MSPLPNYYKEERPWGAFERFVANEPVTVKILTIAPDQRFSLQRHAKRSEFWRVIEGSGTLELDEERRAVAVGDEALVEVGTAHRLTAGPAGMKVLEIMQGEYDEEDIEHLEDDYGRV